MSNVNVTIGGSVPKSLNLRTEEEIISGWRLDGSKPLVSILCITYNHGPYIEDAIHGFLLQETNFPIEIWIHDDASHDGTKEIVESYRLRYPRIINAIYQDENQHSKGVSPSTRLIPHCKGDFVAYCEGDDCWISPLKLKRQVEMLTQHPELDMCLHPAKCIDIQRGKETLIGRYALQDGQIISAEHIIEKKYGQVPTASTMVRRTIYKEMQDFFDKFPKRVVGDIYLHYFGSKRGGAVFINEPMCCYRINLPGSFTARYAADSNLRLNHIESRVRSYNILSEMEGGRFGESFRRSNQLFVRNFLKNAQNPVSVRRQVLWENRGLFDFKARLLLSLYFIFTPVLRLLKKMKSWMRR